MREHWNDYEKRSHCHTVRRVLLFGSRATGTARRASDIDLAVVAPEMSPSDWAKLAERVEESPIIYRIDLLRLDMLPRDALREYILREGIPIYQAEER